MGAKQDTKIQLQPSIKTDSKSSEKPCNWTPKQLRAVPAFYPLERSSRFVKDELNTVVHRVSEANRLLSIHAIYDNENATATLLTCGNVEMHLSLWQSNGEEEGIVIEIQRRKGDSIAFHTIRDAFWMPEPGSSIFRPTSKRTETILMLSFQNKC